MNEKAKLNRELTVQRKHHLPWIKVFVVFGLFLAQTSCSTENQILPTSTLVQTLPTITNTPMPTETIVPSKTPTDVPTPSATPQLNGTWNEEASMSIPRSAHAVASSDAAIYALAGTDEQGKPVLEVEIFDGTQWNIETTLPGRGLNAPTASIVGNHLYVVGGFTAVTNKPTDEVQVYDLQTHQWSLASPLPAPRGGHVAVVLDDKIHVFGGGNSVSTLKDHSEYNPATNTWQ